MEFVRQLKTVERYMMLIAIQDDELLLIICIVDEVNLEAKPVLDIWILLGDTFYGLLMHIFSC